VLVFDLDSGTEVRRIGDLSGRVRALRYSSDGSRLAAASEDAVLRVWDVATGERLAEFECLPSPERVALPNGSTVVRNRPADWALSSAGDVAAISCWDGAIVLVKMSTGERLADIPPPEGRGAPHVVFSRDGKTLAAVSGATRGRGDIYERTIRLFAVPTGRQLLRLGLGEEGYASSVAFSPDGRTLAMGMQDTTIALWDVSGPEANARREGASASCE
jgi:WD40 repeat protein